MSDILYFCNTEPVRAALAAPGKGTYEAADPQKYASLATIPAWRWVLSNLSESRFTYRGEDYMSAEHAIQQARVRVMYPDNVDFVVGGCVDNSGDEARRAAHGQPLYRFKSAHQTHRWNRMKERVITEVLYAKFTQCTIPRLVLLGTGSAQLWSGAQGHKKMRNVCLERVRDLIARPTEV